MFHSVAIEKIIKKSFSNSHNGSHCIKGPTTRQIINADSLSKSFNIFRNYNTFGEVLQICNEIFGHLATIKGVRQNVRQLVDQTFRRVGRLSGIQIIGTMRSVGTIFIDFVTWRLFILSITNTSLKPSNLCLVSEYSYSFESLKFKPIFSIILNTF